MKSENTRPIKQLMTPEQCAEFLRIKVNTLYVMKSQGRIPYRKVGHLLRFDVDEIIEWTRGKRNNDCEAGQASVTIRSTSVAATANKRRFDL